MVRRGLFVSAILMTALCARSVSADVLIGVAASMTGKDAWFGEQMERGAAQVVATSTPRAACSASRYS